MILHTYSTKNTLNVKKTKLTENNDIEETTQQKKNQIMDLAQKYRDEFRDNEDFYTLTIMWDTAKKLMFLSLFIVFAGILSLVFISMFPERFLLDMMVPLTRSQIIILISIIIVNIILFLRQLFRYFFKINERETIIKRVGKTIRHVKEGILDEFELAYSNAYETYIEKYIPELNSILLTFLDYWVNFKNPKILLWIISLITVIPRIILLVVFIIDILYFHCLYYFYEYLWLLIIPYIINIGLFLSEYIHLPPRITARKIFNFSENQEIKRSSAPQLWDEVERRLGYPLEYIYKNTIELKPELKNKISSDDAREILRLYDIAIGVPFLRDNVKKRQEKLNFWLGVLCRITYIIGLSYIIF